MTLVVSGGWPRRAGKQAKAKPFADQESMTKGWQGQANVQQPRLT
jgi:hypothetical protein